ncbi:MAG: S9 family peptidase [Planctomycetota bacterium]|nr:S9 family peptidase [Planctomycetota bacterium]
MTKTVSRLLLAATFALALLFVLGGCQLPQPPIALQVPHIVSSPFGDRGDEYYWMRDDATDTKRPEIMAMLRDEQSYTDAMTRSMGPLRDELLAEIRAHIKEDDASAPVWDRGYWYADQFTVGSEYPTLVRWRGSPDSPHTSNPVEVVLDESALAAGHEFFKIGDVAVSPDGSTLAWTQDTVGRRGHTIHFKNLIDGMVYDDRVDGALESLVWSSDNRTLFYVRQDPILLQSGPVLRHTLGTAASSDMLVYKELDDTLFTAIQSSADELFLCIHMEGYDTNELRIVPLASPSDTPTVVFPREANVRNYADRLRDHWIVRTNDGARNFKIIDAPISSPNDRSLWRDIVPHRSDVSVDAMALMTHGIVVQERIAANPCVRVIGWPGEAVGFSVDAAEPAYAMTLGENPDASNPSIRVEFTSMITPRTTIDVDLSTGSRIVRRIAPVPGFDPSQYETARVWAPSRDGKRIPISIAWRSDAYTRDGTHPLRIEGYGSYGHPTDAEFSVSALPLLDRGFAIALAHIRGGSDLGQDWYEDGRLMQKWHTFHDFIDATRFLQSEGWGSPATTFATGASAGGLLMGVIANEAPDLYQGIALGVPFVDVLTTMLDASIPLTTNEWTQWGNPLEDKAAYEYILSYSPYDNIRAQSYPSMLVSTGLWDSQVMYFEPSKYVARLRRLRTDDHLMIFDINLGAGHGGASGRFERLKDIALEEAFFLDLCTPVSHK